MYSAFSSRFSKCDLPLYTNIILPPLTAEHGYKYKTNTTESREGEIEQITRERAAGRSLEPTYTVHLRHWIYKEGNKQ